MENVDKREEKKPVEMGRQKVQKKKQEMCVIQAFSWTRWE